MEQIIDQIQGTLDAGFPYAALMLALAIPDICSNLELAPGAKVAGEQKRYMRWYNKHLLPSLEKALSAEDCWSLRCGVVHTGTFGNKNQKFERVFFYVDSEFGFLRMDGNSVNGVTYGRTIGIGVKFFIGIVVDAVRKWEADTGHHKHVQANMKRLVSYYPNGLEPIHPGVFIGGNGPCIA